MAWGEPGHYDTLAPVRGLNHAALREPEHSHAVWAEEHAVFSRNERNTTGLRINLGQFLAAVTAKWREVVTFYDGH